MIKLYSVTSNVKEFHGCKDVTFRWFFAAERAQRRPYADLIKHYQADDEYRMYSEGYIEELFSEDEARQLKEYLDREHGHEGTNSITEERLPIGRNVMGVGAVPVGGGDDFYMLDQEPNYSLPFKVWGYFNLVGCELLDGSDVFHHRLMLVNRFSGEVRWQTNQEAAVMEANNAAGDLAE
jgi:hypothetical protein